MNEEHTKIQKEICAHEKQEFKATATITKDILKDLNISIDALPQKYQQLLRQAAETQAAMEMDHLDPIAATLHHTREISQKLEEEYEILKLIQKNQMLQRKIDHNNNFLENLRNELVCSRESLMAQSPNPENIQEHIRQMRQKVLSYEESCEKAKTKYSKLCVPDKVLPKSLTAMVATLSSLKEEALALQQRADDVQLAREARETFSRLRR